LGAELALGFDWLDHLRGEVATTLLDPRETTGDARIDPTRNDLLPLTSRFVAVSHLEFYAEPGRPGLDTFSIGARHLHRSSRYEDPAGQTVLPAQNFLDLEAAASFLDGVFEAHLALRDVFDSRQYDLLGMPLPGRSVHLRGEAWF
jgi:iron complex outermembrane receptor protein